MPHLPETLSSFEDWSDPDRFDPSDLLHPAQAFEHPSHVVDDPDLTLNEKRAILSAWASDACAVESAPDLRQAPAGKPPVRFDDVMDALHLLDKLAAEPAGAGARYRRVLRRQRRALCRRRSVRRSTDRRRRCVLKDSMSPGSWR